MFSDERIHLCIGEDVGLCCVVVSWKLHLISLQLLFVEIPVWMSSNGLNGWGTMAQGRVTVRSETK